MGEGCVASANSRVLTSFGMTIGGVFEFFNALTRSLRVFLTVQ